MVVAGSTGSVGRQTLEVVSKFPDRFVVTALASSGRSIDELAEQIRHHHPRVVAVADPAAAARAEELFPDVEVREGTDGLASLADEGELVVNAVVGFAGLRLTVRTLAAGVRLALANKESLVAGGPVIQAVRTTPGAELVPVDSEHSALHQCLMAAGRDRGVRRAILTASGGPFRGMSLPELARVSVEEALAHPTWSMGPKITVDSSTLMNKGLEVIEAYELFGVPAGEAGWGLQLAQIEVVVHPESVVHSLVEFRDGAVVAQLSEPDMRLPISYALWYPERSPIAFGRIDWTSSRSLSFEPPDRETFRCLGLAYEAAEKGGPAPAWLNAANEVAVEAFLRRRIPWLAIPEVVARALDACPQRDVVGVDDVIAVDGDARKVAEAIVAEVEHEAEAFLRPLREGLCTGDASGPVEE